MDVLEKQQNCKLSCEGYHHKMAKRTRQKLMSSPFSSLHFAPESLIKNHELRGMP